MATQTAAGAALALSAGIPATQDAAGFAALTYTEIGGPDKLGGVGPSFAMVEFKPLKGPLEKHKGTPNYGSLSPSMSVLETDAGQTLLKAAVANQTATYAFKLTFPDGAIRYFQGKAFEYQETVDNSDSIIMATARIEINTKPIPVAAS